MRLFATFKRPAGSYTVAMKHLALAFLVLAAPLTAFAAQATHPPLAPVEGEVIVKFKAGASVTRMHALAVRAPASAVNVTLAQRAGTLGMRVGRSLQAGGPVGERTQVMRTAGLSADALAALLKADADVEYAVPNGRMRATTAPNDPLYAAAALGVRPKGPDSGQWYLRAPAGAVVSSLNIEAAWLRTTGSANIVVAVLDTGVRMDHPDFAGRLLPGYDFVSNATVANDNDGWDADPSDPGDWISRADAATTTFSGCAVQNSSWHGTGTASLVGARANDSVGMAGTAPTAGLLPVRVLGKCFGSEADIQAGMLWAVGIHVDGVPDNPNPARVLNMSLGGCPPTGACTCDAAYQDTVNQVLAKGAVIVVAAGNSSGGPVEMPGNCAGVITVAAIRHVGTKVGFSSLGPEVSISAPGGNCVNTAAGSPCLYPVLAATNTGTTAPAASAWFDSFAFEFGTSLSAPLVAGTAALMLSQQPTLTPAELRARLMASAGRFPTTGGDNGDGSVVQQCQAPSTTTNQLQCYCNASTCGAGMLDAGAAVASVSGPVARIVVSTLNPVAGGVVQLSGASSVAAASSAITGYQWSLSDGGGIVVGFGSATNTSTATLTPSAAGSFTVTLAVTDGQGNTALASQTVVVAAASVVTPAAAGGGGGALSLPWLALLALAVAALFRNAPARRA